ncbi:MAG: hypothetical protein AVDCRST_MAG87-3283, partial [uncultured Thermomicrobiales bacterium]
WSGSSCTSWCSMPSPSNPNGVRDRGPRSGVQGQRATCPAVPDSASILQRFSRTGAAID